MKCRFCDGQVFVGHQVCHLDILVDDSGVFLDNMPGGAEASIYESNTPFGPFRCCGCGAVYDELKDGQKETSGPIEGWKWPGDSPEDADIKGLIALTLIRERPCENEIWADNLFVLIEKEAFQESNSQFVSTETFVMQTLRSRVQTWLATPDGWRSNCCASRDYNWGDLINDLPSEHIQVFFTRDEAKDYDILDSVSVRVAQDELLAPDDVPASLVLVYRDGHTDILGVVVDFQDGSISSNNFFKETEVVEGYIQMADGSRLNCDPESDFQSIAEV